MGDQPKINWRRLEGLRIEGFKCPFCGMLHWVDDPGEIEQGGDLEFECPGYSSYDESSIIISDIDLDRGTFNLSIDFNCKGFTIDREVRFFDCDMSAGEPILYIIQYENVKTFACCQKCSWMDKHDIERSRCPIVRRFASDHVLGRRDVLNNEYTNIPFTLALVFGTRDREEDIEWLRYVLKHGAEPQSEPQLEPVPESEPEPQPQPAPASELDPEDLIAPMEPEPASKVDAEKTGKSEKSEREGLKMKTINLFGTKIEFGLNDDARLVSTLLGVAVKSADGSLHIFDKNGGEITNADKMELGNLPIFIIPTTEPKVGDLIKRDGEYFFVESIDGDGRISVADPAGSEVRKLIPEKNILGWKLYTKVVVLFDGLFGDGGGLDDLFGGGKDIGKWLLVAAMLSGGLDGLNLGSFGLSDTTDSGLSGTTDSDEDDLPFDLKGLLPIGLMLLAAKGGNLGELGEKLGISSGDGDGASPLAGLFTKENLLKLGIVIFMVSGKDGFNKLLDNDKLQRYLPLLLVLLLAGGNNPLGNLLGGTPALPEYPEDEPPANQPPKSANTNKGKSKGKNGNKGKAKAPAAEPENPPATPPAGSADTGATTNTDPGAGA